MALAFGLLLAGGARAGSLDAPAAPDDPGSTGHTLNDVMGKAPAMDEAAGAAPGDVPSGKTFWGLKGSAWGPLYCRLA